MMSTRQRNEGRPPDEPEEIPGASADAEAGWPESPGNAVISSAMADTRVQAGLSDSSVEREQVLTVQVTQVNSGDNIAELVLNTSGMLSASRVNFGYIARCTSLEKDLLEEISRGPIQCPENLLRFLRSGATKQLFVGTYRYACPNSLDQLLKMVEVDEAINTSSSPAQPPAASRDETQGVVSDVDLWGNSPAQPTAPQAAALTPSHTPPVSPDIHETTANYYIRIDFWPEKFKVEIPDGSKVYLMSPASDWKQDDRYIMRQNGAAYSFDGDVPASLGSTFEYKFYVPALGEHGWFPRGDNKRYLPPSPSMQPVVTPASATSAKTEAEKESDPCQDTPEEAAAREKAKKNKQRFKNKREAQRDGDIIDVGNYELRPKDGFYWVDGSKGSLNFAVRRKPIFATPVPTASPNPSAGTEATVNTPAKTPAKPAKASKKTRNALLAAAALGIAGIGYKLANRDVPEISDATGDTDDKSAMPPEKSKADKKTAPKEEESVAGKEKTSRSIVVSARRILDKDTGEPLIEITLPNGRTSTYRNRSAIKFEFGSSIYRVDTGSLTSELANLDAYIQ